MEPVVEYKNLIGSREYRVSVYFSKDMRSFEHIYEGCCPKCMEPAVEYKNLIGFSRIQGRRKRIEGI